MLTVTPPASLPRASDSQYPLCCHPAQPTAPFLPSFWSLRQHYQATSSADHSVFHSSLTFALLRHPLSQTPYMVHLSVTVFSTRPELPRVALLYLVWSPRCRSGSSRHGQLSGQAEKQPVEEHGNKQWAFKSLSLRFLIPHCKRQGPEGGSVTPFPRQSD